MAKAILVMDMPKDCLHCKLRMCIHNRDKYYQHCGLDTDGYGLESFFKSEDLKEGFISERCPLKPMPEKETICGKYDSEYYANGGKMPSWKLGWNACIDAICRKE